MSIYEKLFPWQKTLVDKFKNRSRFGLFLDCGLGKTPISLAFAEQNACEKVIVISINSKATESKDIDGSWFDWASKSAMNYRLDKKGTMTFTKDNSLLLVNYESLFERGQASVRSSKKPLKQSIVNFIESCKGKRVALIIDESHKVKDMHSQQTQSIKTIQKYLELKANKLYTYLLTGTPFTTGYIDLYTQLCFLGYDQPKYVFIDEFCVRGNVPGLLGWQQPISGYKNLDRLYSLVHQYAITIKSEEVVNLPRQIFVKHFSKESEQFQMFTQEMVPGKKVIDYCERHGIQMLDSDYIRCSVNKKVANPLFRNIDYPDMKYLSDTTGVTWMRARELSIGFQGNAEEATWFDKSRLNDIRKFLEEHENNYVIFYNYTPELFELAEICFDLGYNVDVYCGLHKSEYFYERYCKQTAEERLKNNKNVIIANFASGSTGKNWQMYSQCIVASVPLFKDWAQGTERIHRTGQKYDCVYHLFYQENWLDMGMMNALNKQVQYSDDLFKQDLTEFNLKKHNAI